MAKKLALQCDAAGNGKYGKSLVDGREPGSRVNVPARDAPQCVARRHALACCMVQPKTATKIVTAPALWRSSGCDCPLLASGSWYHKKSRLRTEWKSNLSGVRHRQREDCGAKDSSKREYDVWQPHFSPNAMDLFESLVFFFFLEISPQK